MPLWTHVIPDPVQALPLVSPLLLTPLAIFSPFSSHFLTFSTPRLIHLSLPPQKSLPCLGLVLHPNPSFSNTPSAQDWQRVEGKFLLSYLLFLSTVQSIEFPPSNLRAHPAIHPHVQHLLLRPDPKQRTVTESPNKRSGSVREGRQNRPDHRLG